MGTSIEDVEERYLDVVPVYLGVDSKGVTTGKEALPNTLHMGLMDLLQYFFPQLISPW